MREWNATPGDRAQCPAWDAVPQVTTYAYDRQSRLKSVDYPDGRHAAFSYDLAGNRLTETETDGSGRTVKDRRFVCDASNRLRTVRDALVPERSVRYAYNRRGDVTEKTVARLDDQGQVVPGTESLKLSFLWDAPGRLRKVLKAGASGTETAAEFRYDYANRRVSKEARSLLLPGSAPDVRLYALDESAFLCEYRPAAGGALEKVRQHVYGNDLLCTEERGAQSGAWERRYFSDDALVSAVALTGSDGAVAAAYLYDAWGNYRRADVAGTPTGPLGYDPSADGPFGPWNNLSYLAQTQSAFADDPNRLTFTGHEFDPETGLYYAKARFYDPELGRFESEDPVLGNALEPPTLHRYLYAQDDPLTYTDPTGQYSIQNVDTKNGIVWVRLDQDDFGGNTGVISYRQMTPESRSDVIQGMVGNLYRMGNDFWARNSDRAGASYEDVVWGAFADYNAPRYSRERQVASSRAAVFDPSRMDVGSVVALPMVGGGVRFRGDVEAKAGEWIEAKRNSTEGPRTLGGKVLTEMYRRSDTLNSFIWSWQINNILYSLPIVGQFKMSYDLGHATSNFVENPSWENGFDVVASAAPFVAKGLAGRGSKPVSPFKGEPVPFTPKEGARSVWKMGSGPRGLAIEDAIETSGLRSGRLPPGFRGVDFHEGAVISVKSIDLRAPTYQNPIKLQQIIQNYVDKVKAFQGGKLKGKVIRPSDITGRNLDLVIPPGQVAPAQRLAIEKATQYARNQGVEINVFSVE